MNYIPNDWSRVPESVPCNQAEAKLAEIRGIVERIGDYQELQRRYKRVRIRIRVRPDTDAHGLPLSDKNPFKVGRHAVGVILRGVHHAPESPVDHLIERRRRVPAVDPSVEVGGPDQVLGPAVHRHDVAELFEEVVAERKRSDGGEEGNQDRGGQVPRGPTGHEALVGEPFPAVDCRLGSCTAINQKTFGEFGLGE